MLRLRSEASFAHLTAPLSMTNVRGGTKNDTTIDRSLPFRLSPDVLELPNLGGLLKQVAQVHCGRVSCGSQQWSYSEDLLQRF